VSETDGAVFDTRIFADVIDTGTPFERFELAVQLADLVCDPECPQDEFDAVMPSLLRLSADPDELVRRQLAESLAACPDLDRRVVASIAADDDAIALPFLARCQAMDDATMAAIASAGDEARQCAIAARDDLSAAAVSALAGNGSEAAVRVMLDNPAATLDAALLRRLYARFWKHSDIVEQLLGFEELPVDIRILEVRRASSRMQSMVKVNDWSPGDDGRSLVSDAQDRTLIALLNSADPKDLSRLIAFVSSRDMLTPSLLLKAAVDGHMHIVERSLAFLTATSLKRVRKLMYEHGALSLRSLTVTAGVPDECFPVLRAAADVAHAARGEKEWPAPERFGRKVVETLVTRSATAPPKEKMRALSLFAASAAGPTRMLAQHLIEAMERAA
jgi:uncharacterized protein (DUF2336 family)